MPDALWLLLRRRPLGLADVEAGVPFGVLLTSPSPVRDHWSLGPGVHWLHSSLAVVTASVELRLDVLDLCPAPGTWARASREQSPALFTHLRVGHEAVGVD